MDLEIFKSAIKALYPLMNTAKNAPYSNKLVVVDPSGFSALTKTEGYAVYREIGEHQSKFIMDITIVNPLLKSLSGDLNLVKDGKSYRLECGSIEIEVFNEDSEESIPDLGGVFMLESYPSNAVLQVAGGNIKRPLSVSNAMVGNDKLHPVMGGVLFDIDENTLTLVGADGYRLVAYPVNGVRSTRPSADAGNIIIHRDDVKGIIKNLGDEFSLVINETGTRALVDLGKLSIHVNLISGRYPNYNSVIPNVCPMADMTMNTTTSDLLGAVALLKPYKESNAVYLINEDGRIKVADKAAKDGRLLNMDLGPTTHTVNFCFSKNRLEDFLKALQMGLKTSEKAKQRVSVQSTGLDRATIWSVEDGAKYILMPRVYGD